MKRLLFVLLAACSISSVFAQVRKIPAVVTNAFSKQYPNASNVEYHDQLSGYNVQFRLDSTTMTAKYNNKGVWKETDKPWTYEQLQPEVKDGFQKSKYSGAWKVTETYLIVLPDNNENYRVKIEKNDIQKKYLYFDRQGRLLRESITL